MTDRSYTFGLLVVLCVCGFLAVPQQSSAQFIDLRLEIDSQITARTEQPLNFGTLTTNSGRRSIELGSINMGIFSITGLENQMLLVDMDIPTQLQHDNSAISDTVPISLHSRYEFSLENFQDSAPLPNGTGTIKVATNPDPGPWNTIYLFIYGSVNIGDIADGIYANEIVMNVEYI